MRKWLLMSAIVLIGVLIAVYIMIPSHIQVAVITDVHCSVSGANRVLLDESSWGKWWPSENKVERNNTRQTYQYNDLQYILQQKLYHQFIISAGDGRERYTGKLVLMPLTNDSTRIFWNYEISTSSNPFKKLAYYSQARKLKNSSLDILSGLKTFLEKTENIYGVSISRQPTEKTFLVALTGQFRRFPVTEDIYGMIRKMQEYVASENAQPTGDPMVNINQLDTNKFEMMVALPVNKQLSGRDGIVMRRIVTVKALVSTVQGGNAKIQHALKELNHYASDHRLFSPAIPYESLVTDRSKEPDTANWVTHVYLPIL